MTDGEDPAEIPEGHESLHHRTTSGAADPSIDLGTRSSIFELRHRDHAGAEPPPSNSAEAAPDSAGAQRYQVVRLLGQGGMGLVHLVFDRDLRRHVALKTLHRESRVAEQRFLDETQILGQLEHPNIVPLYEIGLTADRRPYYTMRYLKGLTLGEVIAELSHGTGGRTYSLTRLVQIFLQIALAIDYAHAKGVLHRDLKPPNVMLGEHGEVQVLDWGLSKVAAESDLDTGQDGGLTQAGHIVGTPSYMSPEQAAGAELDLRTDVYALGVVLYEMLTLTRPFVGSIRQVLGAVMRDEPVRPRARAPGHAIPQALEAACLKAMRKDPDARHLSARALHDEVQAWLEIESDRAKRRERADEKTREGREKLAEYARLRGDVTVREANLKVLAGEFQGWQPVREKARLHDAERELDRVRDEVVVRESECLAALTEAIGFDREHPAARELLADYYRGRFREAEEAQDRRGRDFFANLVAQYHDGKYSHELAGTGSLRLASDPPGAEVLLYDLVEEDLVLVPRRERTLGLTPIAPISMPMGSYLVVLRREGFRDVRYPVSISRNRAWDGRVRLLREEEIGTGFVHVPAGPFVLGGDPLARGLPFPRTEHVVGDFCIGVHPVTVEEYLEYLNEIADREEALRRGPRMTPEGGSYLITGSDGRLTIPSIDAQGDPWHPRLPAAYITWHDIAAYCSWRSAKEGRALRLPTEEEWEKAARGVDGRWWPWGNRYDPSFCNVNESSRSLPVPLSVDDFPQDLSIYGVRGMAGNVQDFTSTMSLTGEGERLRQTPIVRGASWFYFHSSLGTRCATRNKAETHLVYGTIGFRLAHTPPTIAGGEVARADVAGSKEDP